MDKIEFKGISNMDFKNLYIHDVGIKKQPREKVIVYDEIPGRSGSLIEHTGVYGAYERIITIYDKDNLHEFANWLTGSGDLRISTEEGGFYKASIIEEFDINKIRGLNTKYIEVPFLIQPYFYLDEGQNKIYVENYKIELINSHGVDARPLIYIPGNNNPLKTLVINEIDFQVDNVVDHVYIDSELQVAYSEYDMNQKKILGEFPVLKSGKTIIETHDEGVYIIPRWCKL